MANDDETASSPFTQPKFLLAAVFVLALVVMLVWLLLRGGAEDPEAETDAAPVETPSETPSTDQEAPSESATSEPAEVEASWCGLEAVETEGTLTRAPADTEWQYVGTVAVPAVEGHGPGVIEENGFRRCFAHSPQGAVMATMNYIAATDTAATHRQAIEHLLAAGPYRDSILSQAPPSPNEQLNGGIRGTFEGFRLLSFSPSSVEVDVLIRIDPNGQYVSVVLPLVWEEGDWRVALESEEHLQNSFVELSSPSGYVSWSAVS